MEIVLQTEAGYYVCTGHIVTFKPLPEIVVWGTRFFKRHLGSMADAEASKGRPIYRECFAIMIVESIIDK